MKEFKKYVNEDTLLTEGLSLYDGTKIDLIKVNKILKEVSKIKTIEEMEKYFNFTADEIDEKKPFVNQGIFSGESFSVRFEGKKYASRWIFNIDLSGNITSSSYV